MAKYSFYILLIFGLCSQTACLQNSGKPELCYSDKIPDQEEVTLKMDSKPHFQGGNDSLVSFLTHHLNFNHIISDLTEHEKPYSDKARIKFIINKHGGISELSVSMSKDKQFADEVTRVIKESSCNWVAGRTDQPVTGWHQFDMHYSIEKPSESELKTVMILNEL